LPPKAWHAKSAAWNAHAASWSVHEREDRARVVQGCCKELLCAQRPQPAGQSPPAATTAPARERRQKAKSADWRRRALRLRPLQAIGATRKVSRLRTGRRQTRRPGTERGEFERERREGHSCCGA